jgi:cysteinyl-tRNA synthetase
MTDAEITALVHERDRARLRRDWKLADEIKAHLMSLSSGMYRLALLDEPQGTFWYWTARRDG